MINDSKTLEDFFENELNCVIADRDTMSNLESSKYVIIYGAGSGGAYTKYLLSLVNIKVHSIFDANAEAIKELDGVKVHLPKNDNLTEEDKKDAFVIIGVGNQNAKVEIEEMLKRYGYKHIISYIELFNEVFLMADNKLVSRVETEFYYENKQDILQAFSYFEDQESRDIYCGFIKGHALKANDYFVKPSNQPKYFPSDIEFDKGYDCFIDCGATKGETYSILEKHNIIPKTLVMFEPDAINFSSLVKEMNNKEVNTFLYPCAVYSRTDMIGFTQSGTQGSSINISSNNSIQCVALDDIIKNIEPTFIKMDIEGGEYEGLLGAKSIIIRSKPDLAVCVYHAVNHIWDIPILLKKLNPKYKFYLRSGNILGMNTVLYATNG